jgi:tetratricopeptide (TPR) repeat protein
MPGPTRTGKRAPESSPRAPLLIWNSETGTSPAEDRILTWAAWVLALLLGLVLLLLNLGPHRIGDYFTETDFYGAYADGARLIQHGHLLPARYAVTGPVYECTLALAGLLIPDLFTAANAISWISTVGGLLLCFALLRKRSGARLAFLACLFLAANPYFLRYGYAASTDALGMGLMLGAVCLLLTGEGAVAAGLAGVVAALAFLTRYNLVALFPAGLAILLLGGSPQPRRLRAAAAFAAGFLLPVAPWVLYSLGSGSRFHFALHHNIAYEVFARSRGITWDDYQEKMESQFPTFASVLAKDPSAVLARLLLNLWEHLVLDARNLLGWPVAVCAAAGAALLLVDRKLRAVWPVWLVGGLLYLTLIPAAHSERYSMPLLPAYLSLAAAAFASGWGAMALGRARVPLKPFLAALPLALTLHDTARTEARFIREFPREVLPCARALHALARPGDRILARKAQIGFHSGTQVIAFPYTHTWKELGDYAHREGIRWMFISWPEAETRPEYAVLLDTTAGVPGLTLRYAALKPPALLYEIGPQFGAPPPWEDTETERMRHEALARLEIAVEDPQALLVLGRIANARGRLPEAREYLARAVLTGPKDPFAWMLLGDVCVQLGDGAGAAAAYGHAAELRPQDPTLQIKLGWAAEMLGQMNQAAYYWRPLVSRIREPEILSHMLRVFTAVGDRAAAEAARRNLALAAGGG